MSMLVFYKLRLSEICGPLLRCIVCRLRLARGSLAGEQREGRKANQMKQPIRKLTD